MLMHHQNGQSPPKPQGAFTGEANSRASRNCNLGCRRSCCCRFYRAFRTLALAHFHARLTFTWDAALPAAAAAGRSQLASGRRARTLRLRDKY